MLKVLKKETPKFLKELVELEESVKFEGGATLIKPKCGVESFRFLSFLRMFGYPPYRRRLGCRLTYGPMD